MDELGEGNFCSKVGVSATLIGHHHDVVLEYAGQRGERPEAQNYAQRGIYKSSAVH